MSIFNRIVVTLLLLALAAGAISVIVVAWAIPDDAIRGLRDAVNWLDDNNEDLQKAVLTTGGALVALIALSTLFLELAPKATAEVKVTDVKTADAVLSTAAISQRIEEAVRSVPNIAEVKTTVRGRRKGVAVSLELHVNPDANLAEAAESACDAARQVLSERLHVELVEPPKVRLHYRELRLQRGAQPVLRRPSSEAPPAETPVDGNADSEAQATPAGGPAEASATAVTDASPAGEDVVRQS